MKEEGSPGGAKPGIKLLILLSTLAACVILAFYGAVALHIAIVYTHVFYIPILLAGVWYHKKAVYVALGLGLVHILVTIFSPLPLSASEFVRAAIFIAVAYVISFVSEKAEEEKRLRISVEKLARIIDSSTIPTFVLNRAHKIIHWNAALELLTGVKREEVIGTDKQWQPFYPEKRPVMADFIVDEKPEREISEKYGDKCAKSPLIAGAYEALDFFPSLGESGKWLLFTAAPLRETDGALTGALETVQDITERKLAVDALRASEKQLRETRDYLNNVIESSADAIVVTDMEGIVRAWNKGAEAYMGYTADDEVLGQSNRKFFADPEEPDRIMELVRRDGAIENHRTIVVRKDGTPVHISMSAAFLKDKDGVPIGTVRVSRDITKLVKLEEQVKEERDKLNSIFETMADGVFVISADYKIEYMNKVLRDEFGDQVGSICHTMFHGRKEPCPLCKHPEVMKGKTTRWEWHSSRTNKTFDLIETPLPGVDGTVSKLTIFRDITERKQEEEERERLLKELEIKTAEMERFVYTVSHELRSPLVTIQGFAGLLRKDVERAEVEQVETDLKFIEDRVTMMELLLKDTLETSRIGRVMNPPEDVPFIALVKDALAHLADQITLSGVDISAAEDLPTVHVDRMRIVEVLINLLENGIKFMGDQPQPKIEIGYRIEDKETVFFVKDNGIGLDKSQLEKVFELFYRVDKSGEGTGAGLAIVKRIIEVYGGRIWIESEPGEGCTVCFTLPVVP